MVDSKRTVQSRLEFTSALQAHAAAQALSDVMLDIGNQFFDSTPSLTRGCTSFSEVCAIMTPWEIFLDFAFRHIDFFNDNPALTQAAADSISDEPGVLDTRAQDFELDPSRTFAVWRLAGGPPDAQGNLNPLNRYFEPPNYGVPPAAIPEPSTLALLGLALGSIAASRRRKR